MLTTSRKSDLDKAIRAIHKSYRNKIRTLEMEKPDSVEVITKTTYCFNKNKQVQVEKTVLKKSHRHLINVDAIVNYMMDRADRNEWFASQSDYMSEIFRGFSSDMDWLIEPINKAFGIHHTDLLKDIYHSPRFSLLHEYSDKNVDLDDRDLTISQAVNVLDTIANIKDFGGNEKFTAIPVTSSFRLGTAVNKEYFDFKRQFKVYDFDDESQSYISVEKNYMTIDANIGLLYKYKGHHSFMVSFFVDKELNVYVRQIQGMHKSKGIPAIGKDWRRKVLSELKEKLTFANEFYVIDGSCMKDALISHYGERYVPDVIEPVLDKAKSVYDDLNKNCGNSISIKMAHCNKQSPVVTEIFYKH